MSNLATILGRAGQYGEARRLFAEVIALRRRVLGSKHPKTLSSMDGLANIEKLQGRYTEAERDFREVAMLRREVLGPGHANTLASSTSLAEVMLELGKYADAEPLLREALNAPEADGGSRGLRQCLFGWCLRGQRRFAEAETVIAAGYETLGREQDRLPATDRLAIEHVRRRLRSFVPEPQPEHRTCLQRPTSALLCQLNMAAWRQPLLQ